MGNISCFKNKHKNDINQPLIKRIETEYQENFNEYFNMIKTKVAKFYQENQNNQFNISVSLDRKDFNQLSIPKKLKLNSSEQFVYWKDYLVEYLTKQAQSTNEGWIVEVLRKIEDEIFLKENKWLSLFFWQEFELRTRPIQLEDDKKNINSNSPPLGERLRFSSNLSEKFHSSFISVKSDDASSETHKNVYKDYKKKVKSYISIFTQHINDQEHPINIITIYFISSFGGWLKRIINEIKHLKEHNRFSINENSKSTTNLKKNADFEGRGIISEDKNTDIRVTSQSNDDEIINNRITYQSKNNQHNESNLGKS